MGPLSAVPACNMAKSIGGTMPKNWHKTLSEHMWKEEGRDVQRREESEKLKTEK